MRARRPSKCRDGALLTSAGAGAAGPSAAAGVTAPPAAAGSNAATAAAPSITAGREPAVQAVAGREPLRHPEAGPRLKSPGAAPAAPPAPTAGGIIGTSKRRQMWRGCSRCCCRPRSQRRRPGVTMPSAAVLSITVFPATASGPPLHCKARQPSSLASESSLRSCGAAVTAVEGRPGSSQGGGSAGSDCGVNHRDPAGVPFDATVRSRQLAGVISAVWPRWERGVFVPVLPGSMVRGSTASPGAPTS
ncbi:hypothetical protein ABIE67_000279 [Streptomyces sp. V4I8]